MQGLLGVVLLKRSLPIFFVWPQHYDSNIFVRSRKAVSTSPVPLVPYGFTMAGYYISITP